MAAARDVLALVRVINLAYRVEDFFIDGDRTYEDDVAKYLARPDGAFLVVDGQAPGDLAAAVFVEVGGDRGYFGMLSVNPSYQHQGLGRTLIEAVEHRCRTAGCTAVDIEVVDLREELPAFYSRLGFVPCGQAPFPDPHKLRRPAHLILMTKRL